MLSAWRTPYVQFFLYLQLLDLLTTLVGFRIGAVEASPFIRLLMGAGPAVGVSLSKAVALLLALFCLRLGKNHVILWINYWYAVLIVWNLLVLLLLRPGL